MTENTPNEEDDNSTEADWSQFADFIDRAESPETDEQTDDSPETSLQEDSTSPDDTDSVEDADREDDYAPPDLLSWEESNPSREYNDHPDKTSEESGTDDDLVEGGRKESKAEQTSTTEADPVDDDHRLWHHFDPDKVVDGLESDPSSNDKKVATEHDESSSHESGFNFNIGDSIESSPRNASEKKINADDEKSGDADEDSFLNQLLDDPDSNDAGSDEGTPHDQFELDSITDSPTDEPAELDPLFSDDPLSEEDEQASTREWTDESERESDSAGDRSGHSRLEELKLVDDSSQLLVLSPAKSQITDDACIHLLSQGQGSRNIIIVTRASSAAERLRLLQGLQGNTDYECTIIKVGSESRDTSTESMIPDTPTNSVINYRQMADPSKISRLGIMLTQTLSEWDSQTTQTMICFHSMSHFLEYTDTETLFRFLHTLSTHLDTNGITAHYHLDPSLHDEQVIKTLQPIFDTVVDLSGPE